MIILQFLCLQLCVAICHLLVAISTGEADLLSQDLQESSLNHFSQFLSRSLLFDSESDPEKEERRRLVESTRDGLVQLEGHAAAGLKHLCDLFSECFGKQTGNQDESL